MRSISNFVHRQCWQQHECIYKITDNWIGNFDHYLRFNGLLRVINLTVRLSCVRLSGIGAGTYGRLYMAVSVNNMLRPSLKIQISGAATNDCNSDNQMNWKKNYFWGNMMLLIAILLKIKRYVERSKIHQKFDRLVYDFFQFSTKKLPFSSMISRKNDDINFNKIT